MDTKTTFIGEGGAFQSSERCVVCGFKKVFKDKPFQAHSKLSELRLCEIHANIQVITDEVTHLFTKKDYIVAYQETAKAGALNTNWTGIPVFTLEDGSQIQPILSFSLNKQHEI